MPIYLNNTEIGKLFHTNRNLVQQWRKGNHLINVLHEPSNKNFITNNLNGKCLAWKYLGHARARGVLHAKGIKIKQDRLRSFLKGLKNYSGTRRNPRTKRKCEARSPSSMYNLYSTHKLTHWNFIASRVVDRHSRLIIWVHYSNSNMYLSKYQHFVKAVEEFRCPLQVRGDKGTENRLAVNCMLMLNHPRMKGHISSRLVYNIRIERL